MDIVLLSLADLMHPRILGILLRSLLVTLLIFIGLGLALGWSLAGTDPCSIVGDYECILGLSGSSLGAILLTVLALWFLFPAIALGVICLYADRIAAIIEARHYPLAAAAARPLGLGRGAILGLRSAARVLICNLVALPFYIVLMVTGIGPLILFIFVNGYAFGRDLGDMVAARHGDRAARDAWLHASRGGRMGVGSVVTALFVMPFLNLLAPILGAAMVIHLYHRRQAIPASPRA